MLAPSRIATGFVPQIVSLNGRVYAVCHYCRLRWKVVLVEPYVPEPKYGWREMVLRVEKLDKGEA